MHGHEAIFIAMPDLRHNPIKSMKFGLQVFIDKHQRLKRAAHISIAGRDDFLDCNFSTPGSHF